MDPAFTFPSPGATLRGSIQVFRWDLGDIPLESAWLYAGSVVGGSQFVSRSVDSDIEASLGDLPTDGSRVFVRIWYKTGGVWSNFDAEYTAADEPALPAVTAPASGASLAGQSQRFDWTFSGLVIEASWLYLGSTAGGSDFGAISTSTATSTVVNGLPTDEREIFARLYFRVSGSWYFVDDRFVASGLVIPDTDTLTRELQALVGETADGIVGPRTRAALNRNWLGRAQSFDPSFAARFVNDPDLVRWVQRRMNTRSDRGLRLTGTFDATTESAVTEELDKGGVVSVESFLTLLQP